MRAGPAGGGAWRAGGAGRRARGRGWGPGGGGDGQAAGRGALGPQLHTRLTRSPASRAARSSGGQRCPRAEAAAGGGAAGAKVGAGTAAARPGAQAPWARPEGGGEAGGRCAEAWAGGAGAGGRGPAWPEGSARSRRAARVGRAVEVGVRGVAGVSARPASSVSVCGSPGGVETACPRGSLRGGKAGNGLLPPTFGAPRPVRPRSPRELVNRKAWQRNKCQRFGRTESHVVRR